MRRLLTFTCEGDMLGATIDGDGAIGILMVTGGSQTRIGSHRMYERLAKSLAEKGYACIRFDRRGVGDSEGEDPGFRGSGPEIAAAAAAFRAEVPGLQRIIGFGLCDGATALALSGAQAGLSGVIMTNPWLVETEPDAPPPAAIRRHYRDRLASVEGWKRLLTGAISYRKLASGIVRAAAPASSALAADAAASLARHRLPVALILAGGDATAIAASHEWGKPGFAAVDRRSTFELPTDSHTFARPGDETALLQACLAALERLAA